MMQHRAQNVAHPAGHLQPALAQAKAWRAFGVPFGMIAEGRPCRKPRRWAGWFQHCFRLLLCFVQARRPRKQ